MVEADEIKHLIEEVVPNAHVILEDLRGDGNHFEVYVESPAFAGKSRLDQHRMVFSGLQGRVDSTIQTFSLRTAAKG